MGDESRVLFMLHGQNRGEKREREREKDGDREIPSAVRRCPRAAFPLSVSLDYLLPLHPTVSLPPPPILPSQLWRERWKPQRLLVPPPTPHPHQPPPSAPPHPSVGLAKAKAGEEGR